MNVCLHVKFVDTMEPAIYNPEFYDTLSYVTKFCGHHSLSSVLDLNFKTTL